MAVRRRTFLTSITVLLPALYGQETVSADAAKILSDEWKDLTAHDKFSGLMHCLNALREYTLPGNPHTALKELESGTSKARAPAVFRLAEKRGDLPELLATANDLKYDASYAFKKADDAIGEIYKDSPEELDTQVNEISRITLARALSNLLCMEARRAGLDNYKPADEAKTPKPVADGLEKMEIFRWCYKQDRNKLFGLVSKRFQ